MKPFSTMSGTPILNLHYRHKQSGKEINSLILARRDKFDSDAKCGRDLDGCETAYFEISGAAQTYSPHRPTSHISPDKTLHAFPVSDDWKSAFSAEDAPVSERVLRSIEMAIGDSFVVISLQKDVLPNTAR